MDATIDHLVDCRSYASTVARRSLPLYPPRAYRRPLRAATPTRDRTVDIASAGTQRPIAGEYASTVDNESPVIIIII